MKLLIIGDSISYGFGINDLESYKEIVSRERPDIKVISRSIPGNTSTDMLARVGNDVCLQEPNIIIIQVGLNDCQIRLPLERVINYVGNKQVKYFMKRVRLYLLNSSLGSCKIKIREYERNLNQMIDEISNRLPKSKVLILPITPVKDEIYPGTNSNCTSYNSILKTLCTKKNCIYLEEIEELCSQPREEILLEDGKHLSVKAHWLIALKILKYISS